EQGWQPPDEHLSASIRDRARVVERAQLFLKLEVGLPFDGQSILSFQFANILHQLSSILLRSISLKPFHIVECLPLMLPLRCICTWSGLGTMIGPPAQTGSLSLQFLLSDVLVDFRCQPRVSATVDSQDRLSPLLLSGRVCGPPAESAYSNGG